MALQELQCEATPHLLSRRRSPPRGLPSTNSPAAPHQQSSLCTTTRTLVPQPPLASPQLAHLLLQELRTPSLQQTEATQSWPLQHQPLNTSSQLPHHLHQPSRTHPLRQSLQAARDTSAQPRRRTSPSPDLPRASSSPPQPELSLAMREVVLKGAFTSDSVGGLIRSARNMPRMRIMALCASTPSDTKPARRGSATSSSTTARARK